MKINKVIEHFKRLDQKEVEFVLEALKVLETKLPSGLFKEMYLEELREFIKISTVK